jgi:signal transduction histidine kinase
VIWLAYQDEGERARALVSVARSCQRFDMRLVYLSSRAACEATRGAVWRLEAAPLPQLCFRCVDFPVGEPGDEAAWAKTIEVIRTALFETSATGNPIAAWIESPLPQKGALRTKPLLAYHEAMAALAPISPISPISPVAPGTPVIAAIINAFQPKEVSARTLLAILDTPSVLISAKMAIPRCPAWLIAPGKSDLAPAAGILASPPAPDPLFTPMFQAEKLAALGQLGAGVAHELGNPLSIISSSLQYLHQRLAAANDPATDFTMTALNNVERMHGLLRSMLDFAGAKKPRFERVDLKETISEVLRFTSVEFAQRNVVVEVSFDPFLPKTWADPFGAKQILLNLVKNALDAIVEGAVGHTLRIRTRRGPKRAIVEVENDGIAIPAHVLPNLFRPFYTTRDGGTGLGLYLSRQIAKDHGGELDVENLADGVRFTLTLPFDPRKEENRGAHPDRRR